MNEIISVRSARITRLLCCLMALALLGLQIPTGAFAATSASREGDEMRVRLRQTLTSRYSRVGDQFTAIVVDAGKTMNW